MNILATNNTNFKYQPSFNGATINKKATGVLDNITRQKINNILHAYEDITSKLAYKSEEGIKFITESFPITIKDCLIFHNCGEYNNSIAISIGGKNSNSKDLMHIVRRKGSTTWLDKIVEEAYMIEQGQCLIKDFKTNHMKIFPQERNYMSFQDFNDIKADKNLQKLLDDLDPVMLKFRIFLQKNADKYIKIPDGKMPYSIMEEIKKTERFLEEAKTESKKIPRLQLYKILEEQHEEYVHLKGNSTHSFKNLGDEKVTISFAPIESQVHENLKRLAVYNQDGTLKRVFIMQNDKLVKNTSKTDPTYLANKFEFYDEKEILDKNISGEFLKYLKLYQKSVLKMYDIIHQKSKLIDSKPIDGIFPSYISTNFKKSTEILKEINEIYSKASNYDKKFLKDELTKKNIKYSPAGITLPISCISKNIYFQPVNSNHHSNLLKIAISDSFSEILEYFLIHNDEKIVKNFASNFPNNIPAKLKYLEEDKMPDLTLISKELYENLSEIKYFIEKSLNENLNKKLKTKEDAKIKAQKIIEEKQQHREIKLQAKIDKANFLTEYNELTKNCKKQFTQALKNLDNGLEDFNKTMQEIQQKITEFYLKNKKD